MQTRLLFPAVLLAFAATAHAQQPSSPGDTVAPARSNALLWTASGVALGGAFLLDRRVEEMIPEGGGEGHVRLLDALDHLGRPQALVPLTGAVWAAGKLTRRPQLSASAAHVLIALAAGGVANGTLKYIVGRERPGVEGDRWAFRPFNPNNSWQSFPSGHVVVGFSFAEAVAME
ncbi:MAG: phosphatase PAP2 family protein, partial [Gemmatimonadota bacterium]|nr:phosphatase PAP2 family protein [Gemmatimonadota bacterium]